MSDNEPRLIAKLKRTDAQNRTEVLSKNLERMIRDILDIPKDTDLNHDTPFGEIGLDSISAVKLTHEITENLGEISDLIATKIFDHPSVKELADYLGDQIKIGEL